MICLFPLFCPAQHESLYAEVGTITATTDGNLVVSPDGRSAPARIGTKVHPYDLIQLKDSGTLQFAFLQPGTVPVDVAKEAKNKLYMVPFRVDQEDLLVKFVGSKHNIGGSIYNGKIPRFMAYIWPGHNPLMTVDIGPSNSGLGKRKNLNVIPISSLPAVSSVYCSRELRDYLTRFDRTAATFTWKEVPLQTLKATRCTAKSQQNGGAGSIELMDPVVEETLKRNYDAISAEKVDPLEKAVRLASLFLDASPPQPLLALAEVSKVASVYPEALNLCSQFVTGSPLEGMFCPRKVDEDTVVIPDSEFMMGDISNLSGNLPHPVVLHSFRIKRHLVTMHEYMNYWVSTHQAEPFSIPDAEGGFDNRPMVGLSGRQAADYCAWAGGALPTEAQYERAAGGPAHLRYPFAIDWNAEAAPNLIHWHYRKDESGLRVENEKASAVDSHPLGVSPDGCYDMAGNVLEWCRDYFSDMLPLSEQEDPAGPEQDLGKGRVLRGGSFAQNEIGGWYDSNGFRRGYEIFYWTSTRYHQQGNAYDPARGAPNVGFRVVYPVKVETKADL